MQCTISRLAENIKNIKKGEVGVIGVYYGWKICPEWRIFSKDEFREISLQKKRQVLEFLLINKHLLGLPEDLVHMILVFLVPKHRIILEHGEVEVGDVEQVECEDIASLDTYINTL